MEKENGNVKKYYVVMIFDTEFHLGISSIPNKWINVSNEFFDNGESALKRYVDKCNNKHGQEIRLLDDTDKHNLYEQIKEMQNNFADNEWVNKNVYS